MTKKQEKESLKVLCELFKCKNVKELNEMLADVRPIEEFEEEKKFNL